MRKAASQSHPALENVLHSRTWGTIGPHSLSAAKALSEYLGLPHALTAASAGAALESVLRALNVGYGDEVLLPSWGHPSGVMAALAVGAAPVFADINPNAWTLCPKRAAAAWTPRVRAVIADCPAGNPCNLPALAALCRDKGAALVANLRDGWQCAVDGQLGAGLADAAVLDLSGLPRLGMGGAALTGDADLFARIFAYHNCGRTPGEGSTLTADEILGGNARIAEWAACLVEPALAYAGAALAARREKAAPLAARLAPEGLIPLPLIAGGESARTFLALSCGEDTDAAALVERLRAQGLDARRGYPAMHTAPLLSSPYFQKQTGRREPYGNEGLENSLAAARRSVWIAL